MRHAAREPKHRTEGQTVVMVTHDPAAAARADRVLFLADGRIVDEMAEPTAERVLDRMKGFDAQHQPRPGLGVVLVRPEVEDLLERAPTPAEIARSGPARYRNNPEAAEMAISSPLLEASIDGAHGVLLSIQGGSDLGLFEINEAAQLVSNSAAVDANIIFGAVIDDALGDEVRVTVIAAGLDQERASASASHGAASPGTNAGPVPAPPRPAPSAPASPVTPQTGRAAFEAGETGDDTPPAVGHGSNGSAPAVPDASFASAAWRCATGCSSWAGWRSCRV
jgi:hypothetical protein